MKHSNEECIDLCLSCSKICNQLIAHSLELGGKYVDKYHISLLLSCAQFCDFHARLMTRGCNYCPEVSPICSKVCSDCALNCEEIAQGDEQTLECAEMCRETAKICREVASEHTPQKDISAVNWSN